LQSLSRSLILYDPDLLLRELAKIKRHNAIERRKQLDRLKYQTQIILIPLYAKFEKELARLASRLNELQTSQKGTPSTEPQEAYTKSSVLSQLPPADRYLLKKAYRYASSKTHPDKGGSVEAFQAVKLAYEQGDLTSLQEFSISLEKSVLDQYGYWSDELIRATINTDLYKSLPEFQIARLVQQKKLPQAEKAMATLLSNRYAATYINQSR
jgi:hypothetical protein